MSDLGGAGMVLGFAETVQGYMDEGDADRALFNAKQSVPKESDIPGVNASMMQALNNYKRKSANLSTGIEYRNELDEFKNIAGGGFQNIIERGGSENLMSRLFSQSMNQALGKGAETQRFYDTLFSQKQSEMNADRWRRFQQLMEISGINRDLFLLEYSQNLASSEENKSSGSDNMLGSLVEMAGSEGGIGGLIGG